MTSSSSHSDYAIHFSSSPEEHDNVQGTNYRLLELPQELCKIIEDGLETQFTIRGRTSDNAVLCTQTKTYTVRTVVLSNTFLITSAAAEATDALSDGPATDLIVRDQVTEILELVPAVPKLHRLDRVLRGCEYDDGQEEGEQDEDEQDAADQEEHEGPPLKRARITKEHVRGEIQASDTELMQGIKDRRVLEIDGHLRPLASSYLTRILESVLVTLVSQSFPPHAAPLKQLIRHLDIEHEIPRRITQQVFPWFGYIEGEGDSAHWKMDISEVVKQIGLGHLVLHKDEPIKITEFLQKWSTAVGDTFTSSIDLSLLEGNFLLTPAPLPAAATQPTHLVYFPVSALPVDATHLFADLFLTRPRWRSVDILPFLGTVAIDGKERDKLLMKYARSTTDGDGMVWYTARATHV